MTQATETDLPAQVTVYLPDGKWLCYEPRKSYRIEIIDDEGRCRSVLRGMELLAELGDGNRLIFVQSTRDIE